jgi:hypothetical protein
MAWQLLMSACCVRSVRTAIQPRGDAMFRSHEIDSVTTRLANGSNAGGFFRINQTTDESQLDHDSRRRDLRPLGQRLDDEEDLQLIRQRKWMQGYRIASLVVFVAMVFVWFVSQ